MFLSLFNLLIFGMLAAGGAVIVGAIAKSAGIPPYFVYVLAFFGASSSVLLLSWPLYRMFQFRPLCMPPCPRCHKIPMYRIIGGSWPQSVLQCVECNGNVEVWFCRHIDPAMAAIEMASFCLRWPEFVGWWRYAGQTSG